MVRRCRIRCRGGSSAVRSGEVVMMLVVVGRQGVRGQGGEMEAYVVVCFQQVVDLILCVLLSFSVRMDLVEKFLDGVVVYDRPALVDIRISNEVVIGGVRIQKTGQELDWRICSPIALQRSLKPQGSCLVNRPFELWIVGLQSLRGVLGAQFLQLINNPFLLPNSKF